MPRWITVLLIVALAGCQEKAEMLTSQDLAALLADDTKITFERFHYSGTARFHADKTFEVFIPRLGEDTGIWWLEENNLCSRWANFRQSRKLCAAVGLLPDGTYRGFSPSSKAVLGDFKFVN